MRENKFRAWDRNTETLCNVARIDWSIGFDGHPAIYCVDRGWVTHSSDYILEQFTGLRDKNGREIYEGDILRMENQPHETGVVEFSGNGYWIKEEFANYIPAESMCEIIGNIHENPELLP